MTAEATAADDREVDLIVIGAGPVGENVADYATQHGLTALVVEGELVGGECSYWACMPSKALLRSGAAVSAARRVGGAEQAVTGSLDTAAVLARRNAFTSDWQDEGQVRWLDSAGIRLARGHGRIVGMREVEVDGERWQARAAVAVATGSVPTLPDIPGLAEARPWGSREATSMREVPRRLAVIGGGVVAVELGLAAAQLGAEVTLLARSGLLGGFEPFAGELVADGLREAGVDVRLGVTPERVDRLGDGTVRLALPDGGELLADEVLVATGRTPRTGDVGFETVGLDPEHLQVDDTMRVAGTDWLYVVGDANGRAPLTHQGKYQARAAGQAIAARRHGAPLDDRPWGVHVATADGVAVPQVVFTDPEVASVGTTAKAAADRGTTVRTVDYELGQVAGASLHADHYRGRARAVVDEDRGVLLGVTFVGQDVAELLHAATIAIVGEVPLDRLWHAVPAYPTMSEVWLRLLETYRQG